MNASRLETLANELFVDNITLIKGRYVSPLHVGLTVAEVSERRKKEGIPEATYVEEARVSKRRKKGRRFEATYVEEARISERRKKEGIPEATDGMPFGLPLDRETYLQRVDEFNAEFGNYIRLEIIGEGNRADVVARFHENPEKLGRRFAELGQANGMDVRVEKGPLTYVVLSSSPDYAHINLLLPIHLEPSKKDQPFDPERDKDAPTIILPYLAPGLSIPLMKMYIAAQQR